MREVGVGNFTFLPKINRGKGKSKAGNKGKGEERKRKGGRKEGREGGREGGYHRRIPRPKIKIGVCMYTAAETKVAASHRCCCCCSSQGRLSCAFTSQNWG